MSNYKHGFHGHPLYFIWADMRGRCCNPNHKNYKTYGGRGIKICQGWKNTPKQFIDWALKNGWEKELYLDRRDNDRGYFPDNCRFIDSGLNNRNTQLLSKNNKTGYRGVYFNIEMQKFRSMIKIHGKSKHIGYFSNPISAAIAYDSMALALDDGRPINFNKPIISYV